jgi:c-di-GMP-binding flagellar brake protein YcgR
MVFVRNVLQKLAPANPAPPSPERPALIMDAPAPIRELLARRQLVKVSVTNDPGTYQSLILAIDTRRRLLWLDDLFPYRVRLRPGDELEVSHHRDGEVLAFRATVVALGEHCGVTGLALTLPEAVHYRPRRQWPRLTLPSQPRVPVVLSLPEAGSQYGQILNISAGGLRATVPGNWRHHLRHGEEIPLCDFTLAPGLTVRCRARVCAYQILHRPWRQTHISMAFADLQSALANNLQHYVINHLREQAGSQAA